MKKIIFFLFITIHFNCTDNKDPKSINQFIENFSKGDFENGLPSANDDFYFFIKIRKNEIAKIYNSDLYLIYKSKYSNQFNNYHSFLIEIYNNDLIVNDVVSLKLILKQNVEVFEINNSIQNKNLDDLIKLYKLTESEEFFTITIKSDLDQRTCNNITYKFFKNQYGIFLDCVSGYTRMVKLEIKK